VKGTSRSLRGDDYLRNATNLRWFPGGVNCPELVQRAEQILVVNFCNRHLVYTATREVEPAIGRRDHVANYASAGRYRGRSGIR
jgi:hypothetical protein